MDGKLRFQVNINPRINLAAEQNGVPVVRQLVLQNLGETTVRDIVVTVSADPDFAEPWTARVEELCEGQSHEFTGVDLAISTASLLQRTERQSGHLVVSAHVGEELLVSQRLDIELLAPTEWAGSGVLPELLAAFVMPNDLALGAVLKRASELVEQSTGSSSLDGYQSRDRERVTAIVGAIFEAVKQTGVSYVSPPASFEESGQKIRTPERILSDGLGTCLDLTLLLAALMEQAGLHPLLILVQGHAFPGVWLDDFCLPEPAIDDAGRISKRVRLGEALVFDSSAVAQGASFVAAVDVANRNLDQQEDFVFAVDLHQARSSRHHIRPLQLTPQRVARSTSRVRDITAAEACSVALPHIPSPAPVPMAEEATRRTRLDKWRDKLLDLSLRNKLVNFKESKHTIRFRHLNLPKVEDVLAADKSFEIIGREDRGTDPRDAQLHATRTGENAEEAAVAEDQAAGILRADHEPGELGKRLVELYRRSRTSSEESGTVTLYLAMGSLQWLESSSSRLARTAPLLLIPVTLARGTGGKSFTLRRCDEETRVNATLLKKLSGDFGLNVSGMDKIPEDDSGIDVQWVFDRFTTLVKDLDGWDVKPSCVLSEFSFSKFLMWQDLQANLDKLLDSPIVSHILHGKGEAFPLEQPIVAAEGLDRARTPDKLFTVVDADPSQLQAILAAEDGNSFVLQGPPGTGKSQTITNLISQLLSGGKSVLFVSEKMAALNVVHERLSRVGLAPFCLELHSQKANKRAVMEQLGEGFQIRPARNEAAWLAHAGRLEKVRDQLNEFARLLGERTNFGPTTHQAMSRLIGLADVPCLRLSLHVGQADAAGLETMRAAVAELTRASRDVGGICDNVWEPVKEQDWAPAWQRDVEAGLQGLCTALRDIESKGVEVAQVLGTPAPKDFPKIILVRDLCRAVLDSPRAPNLLMAGVAQPELLSQTSTWFEHVGQRKGAWAKVSEVFSERVLDLDLDSIKQQFDRWGQAFFLVAFFMLWSTRKVLGTAVLKRLPSNSEVTASLTHAIEARTHDRAVKAADVEAQRTLGRYWAGIDTDVEQASGVIERTRKFRSVALRAAEGDSQGLEALLTLYSERYEIVEPGTPGRQVLEVFVEAVSVLEAARVRVEAVLKMKAAEAWGRDRRVDLALARCERWQTSTDELRNWCAAQRAMAKVAELGLTQLVGGLASGALSAELLPKIFERGFYESWWESLVNSHVILRNFRGRGHQALIDKFKMLDTQSQQMAQDALVAKLAARIPELNAPGEEMALLRRQMKLKRRHMPIRKLFAEVPGTLRRLKPCVLMSPLSVAQYLDPGQERFDVVVFDEASQIPPWDAIGAIARGNQVVVVGDSKQLPPTSFFTSGGSDDEDELPDECDAVDMESILEEAIASGIQELTLRWHYRSRHESLIAFSNHHYYEGALNTFPSCDSDVSHLGVKWVEVPDGFYDRGGSRTNRAEADAVVREVAGILSATEGPELSIGIVTFSMAQQRLIEDLMETMRTKNPGLEHHFSESANEPVFIKNLENVQGDERDVILFSICYGPDRNGRVAMNFGPLNREGGERRLNVAITRARQRLVVFSTLRADQIDLRQSPPVGRAHLRTFLDYAARGMAAIDASVHLAPGAEPESPFELEVYRALLAKGWSVHCQVGTSGYRIDLAVVDPERPGTYLMAVECDGATYHSSACARERDRLRQQVLEGLGWRMHRVWSTDWWLDRAGEVERIIEALEAAQRAPRTAPVAPPPPTLYEVPALAPPPAEAQETSAQHPVFTMPDVTILGSPDEFYDSKTLSKIASRLKEVVQVAGPIDRHHAYRQVMACWGLSTLGGRIRAQISEASKSLPSKQRPRVEGAALWPPDTLTKDWTEFRVVDPGDDRTQRKADEIPIAEIANAAAWVLGRAKTIQRVELAKETARVFGINRMGKKVQAVMDEGIAQLVAANRGVADGDTLSVRD